MGRHQSSGQVWVLGCHTSYQDLASPSCRTRRMAGLQADSHELDTYLRRCCWPCAVPHGSAGRLADQSPRRDSGVELSGTVVCTGHKICIMTDTACPAQLIW